MSTRALIAEDEPILAQMLGAALARLWPALETDTVENGIAAVEHALARKPDVLFLDIKMPGKSGLEAAQELAEEWPDGVPFPQLVFVTAYDEYALQAFEQAAADYVLKPVSDERLAKTVTRLKERLERRSSDNDELARIVEQLHALAPAVRPRERLQFIRAGIGNEVRMIPVDDVLYFQAADKYLCVVTAQGETLIRTSLKELLPRLDPDAFWQIHRATAINTRHLLAATRDDAGKLSVTLRGVARPLGVSRVYAHLFRQM